MSSSNSTTWSKDQRVYSMLELQETLRKSALKAMEMLTNSPILAIFTPVLQCVWMGHPHKSHEIKSLFNLFLLWNDNVMLQTFCKSLFSFSRRHAGIAGAWHWDVEKHGHEKGMEAETPWIFETRGFLINSAYYMYVCCVCIYIYTCVCVLSN